MSGVDAFASLVGAAGVDVRRSIARAILPPDRADAVDAVADELGAHVGLIAQRIASLPGIDAAAADLFVARHIEGLGDNGKRMAGEIVEGSHARARQLMLDDGAPDVWRMWRGAEPRIAFALAEALWLDVVAARKHPAVARGAWYELEEAYLDPRRLVVVVDARQLHLVLRGDGRTVAEWRTRDVLFDAPCIDPRVAEQMARSSGRLTAMRLLFWIVHEVYRQQPLVKLYNVIEIDGGLRELARRLGLRSAKAIAELRSALDAMTEIRVRWGGGREAKGLLTWGDDPRGEAPGRPRRLIITAGHVLLPEYARSLPDRTPNERANKMIIPLPSTLPRFYGSHQTHASQFRLVVRVLDEMRLHAGELAHRAAIEIDPFQWVRMADSVQLARRHAFAVRDAFIADGFIEQRGAQLYTLGRREHAALKVILQGAKREQQGRLAGKSRGQWRRRLPDKSCGQGRHR